jgi:beta-xylosidase
LSAPIRLANDAIASSSQGTSATLLSQLDFVSADVQGVRFAQARRKEDDEQHVYREINGEAEYDFTGIDRIYDRLLDIGLRPVVELSFMPHDLASDPKATVFMYRAIISPPRDWNRWGELNHHLAVHLVERYGIEEVSQWGFEVWNEANLKVFWTGTQEEYFRLYEIAARAIKSVDERLLVGVPPARQQNGSSTSWTLFARSSFPWTSSRPTPTATCRWT